MSDQHAATTLTAAAVVAVILIARAAVLRQDRRGHTARATDGPARRTIAGIRASAHPATPLPDASAADAHFAVREAEQHVQRCWRQLQTRVDPPE